MVKPRSEREQHQQVDDPKYKGVRKRKWGKWVSEIRLPNSRERIWLGSYDSPEKAARAFDAALFCLRGRGAKLNFPNCPPDIPGSRSLTRQEIQAAAARFANEEAPPGTSSFSGVQVVEAELVSGPIDDWSFLDLLDSGQGVSDFGLHDPASPVAYVDDNINHGYGYGYGYGYGNEGESESYSQHSFLWDF